jgi:hypothetical protein
MRPIPFDGFCFKYRPLNARSGEVLDIRFLTLKRTLSEAMVAVNKLVAQPVNVRFVESGASVLEKLDGAVSMRRK